MGTKASASAFRKVYRMPSQTFAYSVIFLAEFTVIVDGSLRSHVYSVIGRVLFGPLCLLINIAIIRAALAVVIVTDRQLTVRNPFRTLSIAWNEVVGFDIGRYKLLGDVCLIRLRNGRVVPAFALQGITGQPSRRTSVLALKKVDELNQWLIRAVDAKQ